MKKNERHNLTSCRKTKHIFPGCDFAEDTYQSWALDMAEIKLDDKANRDPSILKTALKMMWGHVVVQTFNYQTYP